MTAFPCTNGLLERAPHRLGAAQALAESRRAQRTMLCAKS